MSETTTLLKVGSAELVLRLIEAGTGMRDFTLENPIRAIRDMSRDRTGQVKVSLANGRRVSALELQTEYYDKVSEFVRREGLGTPTIDKILDLWERTLRAVAEDKLGLIDTEIDWAIKYKLLDRYSVRHNLSMADARIAQLDLAYHDIRRTRGLFSLLEKRGGAARVTTDPAIFRAKSVPPQTTRARLRGEFIKAAQDARSDYTVDWVHLKLNDQAQRTVLCKDPFVATDERVDRLIASMRRVPS
jgi:proteasome accessory factor A